MRLALEVCYPLSSEDLEWDGLSKCGSRTSHKVLVKNAGPWAHRKPPESELSGWTLESAFKRTGEPDSGEP